jgi:error-prone DNA polymerase
MFIHLNCHSVFSKMHGTATQAGLLQQARHNHMSHLALTEINGLWGFIDFVKAARACDILPIAGCNLIGEWDEAVLLAASEKGYRNMCFILSNRHKNPAGKIWDWVEGYSADIFFLSQRESTLKRLAGLVSAADLFVELRPGVEEGQAHQLAERLGLQMVATGDVYFLNPADEKAHKVLRAIDLNKTLSGLQAEEYKNGAHYFRSEEEMIQLFPNSLQAINNSFFLAERCHTDWQSKVVFPAVNEASYKLRKMVFAGAKKRYGELNDIVKERIEYELSIIIPKGFAPYFLVIADIVAQTKATIGRGSGAASIISFSLGITQVEPIRYNLQFERFIHPQREDMPDIDIDFPWDERDDIIAYIFNKYGMDHVAMVSNQVFIKPRSAIREVSKVHGLSNEEIKSVTKRLGYFSKRSDLLGWIQEDKRFENVDLNDTLRDILIQSEKVMGAFRTSSVHCGGVIITPDDIRNHVPVLMAPKGVQIVEWEKDQVEDSGLQKIDILGNRSLAVVRDTLKQVKMYRKDEVDARYVDYHSIPSVNDPQTRALMEKGLTMGVFYIESPATRLLLRKARVVDFEHVVIYSSIIRPAANRYINVMIERIHGAHWEIEHPHLECLRESYGIMVYEEQVSMVARAVCGFNYADSDFLRKVISRPKLRKEIPKWKKKFIDGALTNGHTQQMAESLWEMIQSFSGYSFCKPHSASYAMLSFTCAYLKAHFPAEFLAAVISNQGGYYSSYAYLSEARRRGIKILKPDINLSNREYKGRKNKIRMGFMAINNLQGKAVDNILKARESGNFKSLRDFVERTKIDFSDAVALTNAGCFNMLEADCSHQEIAYKVAYAWSRGEKEWTVPGQAFFKNRRFSREELRQLETDTFGFPVTEHPLQKYLSALEHSIQKARDIAAFNGRMIKLAGVYITRKIAVTKNKEAMTFVTFEDETDIFECVMFPKVFDLYADLLNWEKLYVVSGRVEEAFGVYTINVQRLVGLGGGMD